MTGTPIEAIRTAPGEYILATETITTGLEFAYRGTTYAVVGDPVTIGYRHVRVRIRVMNGSRAGEELDAYLRAGHRQP